VHAENTAETGSKMRSIAFSVDLDMIPDTRTAVLSHCWMKTCRVIGTTTKLVDVPADTTRLPASFTLYPTIRRDPAIQQSRFMPNYNGFRPNSRLTKGNVP